MRIGSYEEFAKCGKKFMEFVGSLLQARGDSLLETCELLLYDYEDGSELYMNRWICHAVMCKVQVLRLAFSRPLHWFELESLPLISWHLTTLVLFMVELSDSFVDFCSCLALEHLEIDHCLLPSVNRISSQSLKSLSIIGCCSFGSTFRTQLHSPNLILLRMESIMGRVPILERMLSLVEAVVQINSTNDTCECEDGDYFGNCSFEECDGCYGVADDTDNCVLLQSLSQAKKLVLLANIEMIIFRRDLKWCPIFSNLKNLVLNEYWCVPGDLSALACILQHSPVLEKLTLQLFCKGPKSKVHIKGSPDPAKRSTAISEHLKIVEVKCEVLDEKIQNVLEFLSKLNIYSYKFHFEGSVEGLE
ncbi:unnamed protein product [Urochloa decumbens]|uniref:F-box/LRR-repeat protein n=1 Tax=Urochloa decumbens TaxID=240449 RepID=A0ABC8VS68_9POAL